MCPMIFRNFSATNKKAERATGSVTSFLPIPRVTPAERATGIEPAYPAWEAGVLPLNYAREGAPLL